MEEWRLREEWMSLSIVPERENDQAGTWWVPGTWRGHTGVLGGSRRGRLAQCKDPFSLALALPCPLYLCHVPHPWVLVTPNHTITGLGLRSPNTLPALDCPWILASRMLEIWAYSKWTWWIQPAHKISQIPFTSHLFLPCWVYKYVGQGTSFSRTGERRVWSHNYKYRAKAGWGCEGARQGPGQPGKPHLRSPACNPVSSWECKKTEVWRGRDLCKATQAVRVRAGVGHRLLALCRLLPCHLPRTH